jgi:integrase
MTTEEQGTGKAQTQGQSRPRRPKGTGSIKESGKKRKGLKQFRLRVFVMTKPGTRQPVVKQRTVWVKNSTAAEAEWKKFDAEVKATLPRVLGLTTVSDLLTQYAEFQVVKLRAPGTINETRRTRDAVWGPLIGHIDIRKLTPQDIDGAYALLAAGGKGHRPQSPSSLRRYRAVLSSAFNYAVDYGLIEGSSPVPRAKGIPEVADVPLRVPSATGVRRFLAEAEKRNANYGMIARLAILTAARRGEICALRWSHLVETENGPVLKIEKALYRAGKEHGEKEPKGRRARAVPVNTVLAEALETWRKRCVKEAKNAGVSLVPDAFIVSSLPDGSEPVKPDSYTTFQGDLAEELGVDLGGGRNPFRHFGGTAMAATVSPADGAAILGHASTSTYLDRYTHATPKQSRAASEILADVLRGEGERKS